MDENIKESLKKDLDNQNTPETVKSFIEDVKLYVDGDSGYEDILAQAKTKLNSFTQEVNVPIPSLDDINQKIEEKGGTPEVLEEKVVEVNTGLNQNEEEIKKVQPEAIQEIEDTKKDISEINSGISSEKNDTENNEIKNERIFDSYISQPGGMSKLMENFDKLKEVNPDYMSSKLFEEHRSDIIARLPYLFDIGKLAPQISDDIIGVNTMINQLRTYPNTWHENIAQALIDKNESDIVKRNLEKFNGLSEDFKNKNHLQ